MCVEMCIDMCIIDAYGHDRTTSQMGMAHFDSRMAIRTRASGSVGGNMGLARWCMPTGTPLKDRLSQVAYRHVLDMCIDMCIRHVCRPECRHVY